MLIRLFKKLFQSSKQPVEMTRILSTYTRVDLVKLTESQSNEVLAYYLFYLIRVNKLKGYHNVRDFINNHNPDLGIRDNFPYNNIVITKEMKFLSKKAKLLRYQCKDEEFITWLKNI